MSSSIQIQDHLLKILVIGEPGVGKTSLIKRYVHSVFTENYKATIGVDFALKVVPYDAQTTLRLQFWDIAGQDRPPSRCSHNGTGGGVNNRLLRVYFREAVGAFVVCDASRAETQAAALVGWKRELDAKVQLSNGEALPCVLLANKCDCPKDGLSRDAARMSRFCQEQGFCMWFETSAKLNTGIEEAVQHLIGQIMETVPFPEKNTFLDPLTISLHNNNNPASSTSSPSPSQHSSLPGSSGCC